ncbi:unnamed protein product, partial [Ixodes hexagonus]
MSLKGYELFLLLLWSAWCSRASGDVVLSNNGYKGVTVALSPRVPAESLRPDFLQSLVELLNSASRAVFKETNHRAFFEEVTLVVPRSLDAENFPNGTDITVSSNPSFKSAHVLIEPDSGVLFGGSPYTLQYGPCGTPGLRTVLPVSNVVGQNGSAMAREWLRLRYGVFTEDFIPNDPLYSEHSPSKQEVLCFSKSCHDVVMASSDFRGVNLSGESVLKGVRLNVIKEAPLRLVVVWNIGSVKVEETEKYEATMRALWKFARLEAPDDAELAIIYYGTEVFQTSDVLLRISASGNRDTFAVGFPESKHGADMTEALTKARDLLATSNNPDGGSILLITNENAPANDVNATFTILSKSNVKLNALILSQQDGDNGLEQLCSDLGGKVAFTPKAQEAVSITLQSNAISSLALGGTTSEEAYSTINIETLIPDSMPSSAEFSVPLEVDFQSAKLLRVDVITENIDRTGSFQYSLKLSSPGGIEFKAGSPQLRLENIFHQWEFRIPNPAPGRWTLRMTKTRTMSNPIIVDVKIKPGSLQDVSITVDTWLSSSFVDIDPSKPLIFYAELKKGSAPIRYATVKARVTGPNGTEFDVELVDNGAGDPDITAGDGIYSRYFTGFSDKGRYALSVVASGTEKTIIVGGGQPDNDLEPRCCGSEFPTSGSRPSGSFSRSVQYGSFFVITQRPPGDIYPPSRITDLKVVNVERDNMRVTLRWTAPGNDFDQGTAKGYDIRSFDRAVKFAEDFDAAGTSIDPFNIDGLSGSPKLSGEIEEATVFNFKCSRGPTSCFFAVRAYDEVRSGPVSNVVEVTFPEVPPDSTEAGLHPHPDGNETHVASDNDRNYARGGLTSWQLGLAIGLPLLLFLILILLLVMCVFFRRRHHADSKDSSPPPPTRPRPIISSPIRAGDSTPKQAKDENRNHYAVSVLSGSTISPVNSYSADYLMDKYEEEKKQKQDGIKAPTAPPRSDAASSDGETSMDTAVGEQNWWTPRARNSQEMGLPLNPTY